MDIEIKEGQLNAQELKIAIVATRFNDFIVNSLVSGAVDSFIRHSGKKENLSIYKVPGSLEIPLIAKKIAQSTKYDAIVALGAVIRGSTYHFEIVANESAKGIASISSQYDIPVSNGILTTDNIEQAIERAGTKAGNKGSEAMIAAIESANLSKNI